MKIIIKKIVLILLIFIFIVSVANMIVFFRDIDKNKNSKEELIEEIVNNSNVNNSDTNNSEKSLIDFNKLLEINKDTKGWIKCNQDKINYPIVQSNDNSYYLTNDFENKKNQTGSIFLDYRNNSFNDRNTVIYGHAMIDDSMFGSLNDVFKRNYFNDENNQYIKIIDLDNQELTYQIFSYYIIEKEEYYITTSFNDDVSFQEFIKTISERSYKAFNLPISIEDKILTLSTCSGVGNTTKRKVIHAKLIKKQNRGI